MMLPGDINCLVLTCAIKPIYKLIPEIANNMDFGIYWLIKKSNKK